MSIRRRVEFVDYDGMYPNLCSGALSVKLDGKLVVFKPSHKTKKDEKVFESFWSSSDCYCYGKEAYDKAVLYLNGWTFTGDDFPEELSDYYFELCHVFAENVEAPHCGGCW